MDAASAGADNITSLPPREAWIEIDRARNLLGKMRASLPPREAWIEIVESSLGQRKEVSRFPHGKRGLK